MSSHLEMTRLSVAFGILASFILVLAVSFILLPNVAHVSSYSVQSHALNAYLAAYLAFVIFLVCLRRFHLQRTREFLFWGVGFVGFAILQVLHVLSHPGFHDVSWIPSSENIAVALNQAGRLLVAVYFVLGLAVLRKPLLKPTFRNTGLIYVNGVGLVFFVSFCLIFVLPPPLMINGQVTLLKKLGDAVVAGLWGACLILSMRTYMRERRILPLALGMVSVVGISANLHLSLWGTFGDLNFLVGHILHTLFFAILFVTLLLDYSRYTQLESALGDSLKIMHEHTTAEDASYRVYVERMKNGLIVVDKKGLLSFCNRAFAALIGLTVEDVTGKHISLLLEPKSYEAISLLSGQNKEFKGGYHEIELLAKGGIKIRVGVAIAKITSPEGEYAGVQAVTTDASLSKKAKEELEGLVREKTQSLEMFEQCIEHSTEGVLIADPDGKITYVNQAFERMTGFSKSSLVRQDTSFLQHDPQGENKVESIWKAMLDGRVWRGELATKKHDGGSFLGELSVVPIRGDDGQLLKYLWIERDITRKKALEKSLEQYAAELSDRTSDLEAAKSYHETLISGISDILIVVDNEGDCTFINDYGKNRLSMNADELTKDNLPVFFDDLKRLENDYGSALKLEIKDFEAPIRTKDGESILCSWHARPLFDSKNRRLGAVTIGRDITEYKKIQEELYEYTRNLEITVKDRTRDLHVKINQLARLLEIEEEIRRNANVDVVLHKICDAAQDLGWKRTVITLRDEPSQTSQVVAAAGLAPAELEKVMGWRIPISHSDFFLKEEHRLSNSYFIDHSSGVISEETPYSLFTEIGGRRDDEWHKMDALIIPIRAKDKMLGQIGVDDPKNRKKPRLEDVRDLEILADHAAIAIDNAQLSQAQQESENRTKVLSDISRLFYASLELDSVVRAIVQKGAEAVGELCSLFLVDQKGQFLTPQASFHPDQKVLHVFTKGLDRYRLAIGKGLVSEVVTTGKTYSASRPFPESLNNFVGSPVFYLEQKYTIASLVLVPLQVRDRRIGAMLFVRIKSPNKYDAQDLGLAHDLADRASLAIENARLFKEAGEKAGELEKANRLKSEFLANVSHELRTPLNAIITLSDILIRGIPGNLNAEQSKQIQIIQRSGRNLLNLISDILDLSKIEAGRLEPLYSVIPIKAVVEETVEHIRPLCHEKGLALHFESAENVPDSIYSDQDKLTKALTNVLSNAVKFTPKGKILVTLSLTGDASRLKITVTDTGIGIPSDRLEEIFKEFHQVDSSASRTFGGTGLGLAITRNVLSLVGGQVTVQSQLGKGSTFELVLPLRLKPEVEDGASALPTITLVDETDETIDLNLKDDRNRLDQKKKAILVVDDEKEAIYMIRQYLSRSRYQLIFPTNGEDAVELARKYKPYAITLDLIMPHRSGWQVLRALKRDAQTRNIPVIITSVLSEKERAFQMGAVEYMVKPFEPEKLIRFLESLDDQTEMKKIVLDLPKFINLKQIIRSKMQAFRTKDQRHAVENSTVLLVDDDADTQYAVRYILEEVGYTVFVAGDGSEAVQQAESIKPSLILMDMMMPGMDGFEATAKLRSHGKLREVPIVAMTAKAMKGDRQKILDAGCDDYLAKPFMSKDILKMVERWATKRRTVTEPSA